MKYLSQICCGVNFSSKAFVSVAVPYSSVPLMYNVFHPRNRQYLLDKTNLFILLIKKKLIYNQYCEININIQLAKAVAREGGVRVQPSLKLFL